MPRRCASWVRAMRSEFVRALAELAAEDPRVLLVNGDLGFGVLDDFVAHHPACYVNAGVAEQNMTAVACGAAMAGAHAYTYSIGNFPTLRCLEQLRNDVCHHGADVTVVAVGGGFSYGQLGMSHFATEDLAILRTLPGMTVVAPSDPWQAYALTRQLHARGGPCYLRLDKGVAGLPEGAVVLGKAREVRAGEDAVIFAIGSVLGEAVAAADLLAREGAAVAVIDVHTIKPLDVAAIAAAVRRCGRVVTLEEHSVMGGLGGAIAEACLDGGAVPRSFTRIGIPDRYPEVVGHQAYLRAHMGLDRTAVAARLRQVLG
jgi:transketolase